ASFSYLKRKPFTQRRKDRKDAKEGQRLGRERGISPAFASLRFLRLCVKSSFIFLNNRFQLLRRRFGPEVRGREDRVLQCRTAFTTPLTRPHPLHRFT